MQTMSSREMYNSTHFLTSSIAWDNDWIHFGTADEIKFDLLGRLIRDHLSSEELLFIYGRTTSGQYQKEEIFKIIKPILGKDDFYLWTVALDKVIEFSRIGVLHLGHKKL